jgi:hypothetical protein
MSSLQELVLVVARKATTATGRTDIQWLVQKSSLQRTTSCTDKKCENFKGEKAHTMISQMLSVCLIKGGKVYWRRGTSNDLFECRRYSTCFDKNGGQATICSNVVVAVPVLARKARTVQERRAVLPEIIVSLLKSSFLWIKLSTFTEFVRTCTPFKFAQMFEDTEPVLVNV